MSAVALETAVPKLPNLIKAVEEHLEGAQVKEKCWLEHSLKLIEKKEELDKGDIVAWSAYHVSIQDVSDYLKLTLTQLLPLFYEKAATASMIKYGMDIQC